MFNHLFEMQELVVRTKIIKFPRDYLNHTSQIKAGSRSNIRRRRLTLFSKLGNLPPLTLMGLAE